MIARDQSGRRLPAWALPAAALVLAVLWALDAAVLRLDILTTFQDARAASPLYAFWRPVFRPELLAFAAAAGALVVFAPRWTDPARTARGLFRAWLLAAALVLPLALFLVRQPISELGTSFSVYENEEFYDDALKIPLFHDDQGRSGLRVFLKHYVEAMPQLSLHGQHFPPGHALWLHAVGRALGTGLFAAGACVLVAFAAGVLLVHAALARLLDEAAARQGALLLLAAPSLLDFACTAMDAAFFTWGMLAWLLALRALEERAGPVAAGFAGLAFAAASFVSFAALPLGLAVAVYAVVLGVRRLRLTAFLARQLAVVGAAFAAAHLLTWLATGFAWWDCLAHGRAGGIALMTSILKGPPGSRWLEISYGNAAAFLLGAGLALTCLPLARPRSADPGPAAWRVAALVALAIMTIGGLFFMETERIWLFALPWVVAVGLAPGRLDAASLRWALAAGLAQALALEVLLYTIW